MKQDVLYFDKNITEKKAQIRYENGTYQCNFSTRYLMQNLWTDSIFPHFYILLKKCNNLLAAKRTQR